MLQNKIIIAINSYERENQFVNYGVQLAKRLDRPATLTGVTRAPVPMVDAGPISNNTPEYQAFDIETIRKENEVALQKIYMKAREQYEKLDYEVEIGFPEATIINKSTSQNLYMLIVEGSNHLSTLGEWFGTYETRLAEHTNVPTLVVPSKYTWKPVHDILYVMELVDEKAKNIRRLYELATNFNANLHIMLIAKNDSEETENKYKHLVETLRTFYNYRAVRYSLVTDINSAKEVTDMIDRMAIDWLAIEHSEESFIGRIFSDLNSDRIILQSKIPVLVF